MPALELFGNRAATTVSYAPSRFVQKLATGVTSVAAFTMTITIDGGKTSTPGNVAILDFRCWGGGALSSVADSRGNAWQVDNTGDVSGSNIGVASAPMGATTYLRAGDTVTVTCSGTTMDNTGTQAGIAEFAGLDTSAGHTVVRTTAETHVIASPATAETASAGAAGDLVLTAAVGGTSASTFTPPSSDADSGGTWTDAAVPGTASVGCDMAYEIAAGASAYKATWAWAGGGNGTASITVYKAAVGAPPAGTAETWKVASSSGFPTVATGTGQFRITDPAAPTEVMLVTAISGTSWTVVRGYEGTVAAHAAGFTVRQVITSGSLDMVRAPQYAALTSSGYLSHTFDIACAASAATAIGRGQLNYFKIPVYPGMVISALDWWQNNAAGTPVAGESFAALYGQSGGSALVSAGIDTQAGATGLLSAALSYTVPAGVYWLFGALLFNGSANPNLGIGNINQFMANANCAASNIRFGLQGSSLTALPSLVLSSGSYNFPVWLGLR